MVNRKLYSDRAALHVRLPEWLLDAIEEMATKNSTTVSQVVREALKIVFAEVNPQNAGGD